MSVANKSSQTYLIVAVVACLVGVSLHYYLNRGYGEVSYPTYQVATALYSACLAKSSMRIELVEDLLKSGAKSIDTKAIPDHERVWLEQVIDKAKREQWESAAASAKRMMSDQLNSNGD